MNTTFRNIHCKPAEVSQPSTLNSQLPRLRVVTNDPAREYSARPGAVEKLPDSVAALILCKQGFNKVGRNGITIELDGRKLNYWSEGSVTCATKAGTNEKVLWTVNRQLPDVLHILTMDGEYIESIPQAGTAQWFNADDAKILAATKRANLRRMERVAHLHKPDSAATLARELHNEGQIKGLVQTFPAVEGCGHRMSTENVHARARVGRHDRAEGPELGRVPERNALGRSEIRATRPQSSSDRENLSRADAETGDGSVGSRYTPNSSARENLPGGTRAVASFDRASRLHEVQRSLGQQRAAFEAQTREDLERAASLTAEELAAATMPIPDSPESDLPFVSSEDTARYFSTATTEGDEC